MTPEAFRQAVAIENDPLDFNAVLSTEPAFRQSTGATRVVWNDAHLRAVIDKRTGAVRYEVEQRLRHAHGDRVYRQVNYVTPTGLRQAVPVVADLNDNNCVEGGFGRDCVVFRKMSFEIAERDLRDIAATYTPGHAGDFAFRFKDAAGHHHTNKLVPAEVAGLLQAVTDFHAAAGSGAAAVASLNR